MTRPQRSSSPELAPEVVHRAIVEGSDRALTELYWHYQADMRYAIARAAHGFGRYRDMEDLTQEVWARLLRKERRQLRYYDPTRGACGRFLRALAFNNAWRVLYRERNRVESVPATHDTDALVDDDAAGFVARIIYDDERRKLLACCKAELSDKYWQLLLEHHIHGRTLRSIADENGENEEAVQQRNLRLKRRLARLAENMKLSLPSSTAPSRTPSSAAALVMALLLLHTFADEEPGSSVLDAPVTSRDAPGDFDDA